MRISMTLPKKLIDEFDECLKKNGYNSRSKGLIEAMNEYIKRHK